MQKKLPKRLCAWLLACVMMLGLCPAAWAAGEDGGANAVSHVIVNQVYGASNDGYASHSFIELYNPTSAAVDMSGWSVQYRSSADGDHSDAWVKLDLTGTIGAEDYYLIRCGAITDTKNKKCDVTAGNQEWNIQLHNKGLSVALVNNQVQLADNITGNVSGNTSIIDVAACAGNDYKAAALNEKTEQLPPAWQGEDPAGANGLQSKKKAIRRMNFTDTDTLADFEAVDYSKTVDADKVPHKGSYVPGGGSDPTPSQYPWDGSTDLKIAVISDCHIYDGDTLGKTGTAFETYLARDRKMLVESRKILEEAVSRILASDAEVVLIPGDLTKDSEMVNHKWLAGQLTKLENAGKQVFLINGNHDISNANAKSYNGADTQAVESATQAKFRENYAAFGYDEAVAKDEDSLSYAVDLGSSYRLIAMDDCLYNNSEDHNTRKQTTGGSFDGSYGSWQAEKRKNTLEWVLEQIKAARQAGRIPIGLMHHGLVPHNAIQDAMFNEYLIKDHENIATQLADAGMSLVFTGHYHSQDAAMLTTDAGNRLYDVETGSLIAYPSPIRWVALDGRNVSYTSTHIAAQGSTVNGLTVGDLSAPDIYRQIKGNAVENTDAIATDFHQYAYNYLITGLEGQAPMMLTAGLVSQGVDPEHAAQQAQALAASTPFKAVGYSGTLASFLAACMSYHYAGDEDANNDATYQAISAIVSGLMSSNNPRDQLLGSAAYALIHDTTSGKGAESIGDNAANFTLTTGVSLPGQQTVGFENGNTSLKLAQIGRYNSGVTSPDGGVMEIVDYNKVNHTAYAVNGHSGKIAAIPMTGMVKGQSTVSNLPARTIDVQHLVTAANFTYGDMTSVAVSPDGKTLAVAIQAKDYTANGRVALFACKDDGSLAFEQAMEVGVQPDMVTFTPDGSKILTANEGEPRQGYGEGAVDPKGSVSVITASTGAVVTVDFTKFDSTDARAALVAKQIVLKKNAAPSVDLEPEYIACDDHTAYITCQEANAIAILDLDRTEFTDICSVGFEDYSKVPVDIDKSDKAYAPKTYEGLMGIRMPDAVSLYQVNGKTYLLTANEGDARSWPVDTEAYSNERKNKTSPSGQIKLDSKVTWYDPATADGLESGKDYLFGGRTFTVFQVTDSGLTEVYSSGSDFERLTAQYLPEYFNCSNDDLSVEDRSGKKGPEPETVTTGTVGDKTYAFITLERIGGVMVYDMTDPANVSYVNYINSRDFSSNTGLDDSPEGLKFVPAASSPTGSALLLAACEVGGTVAVYELSGTASASGSSSGSSARPYDTVSVSGAIAHGSVSVSPTRARQGDTVTITVTPDKGYVLETLNALDKDGKEIKLTEKGGKYTFTMPASKVEVKATFMVDNTMLNFFVDVKASDYFYDAVLWAAQKGITTGVNATEFGPSLSCTRGQIVTFLWRAAGSPVVNYAMNMRDVPEGSYYAEAVRWALSEGITTGTTESTFSPDAPCTRAQAVAFLFRYAAPDAVTLQELLSGFSDAASVPGYALSAMNWAIANGIVQGDGSNLLPNDSCTRAQIVTLLYRALEK